MNLTDRLRALRPRTPLQEACLRVWMDQPYEPAAPSADAPPQEVAAWLAQMAEFAEQARLAMREEIQRQGITVHGAYTDEDVLRELDRIGGIALEVVAAYRRENNL